MSVLASLLGGYVFVPLDPDDSVSRLETLVKDSNCQVIMFLSDHLKKANMIRWSTGSPVKTLLCLDETLNTFESLIEKNDDTPLMSKELWKNVVDRATDDIDSGGWRSSYDGQKMTSQEMHEYASNVYVRLEPIGKHWQVLEIGCGSGLTAKRIAPCVTRYVATDLSKEMLDRLRRQQNEEQSMEGARIEYVNCSAHELMNHFEENEQFDVVILNSVIHCFPGHSYFGHILSIINRLLKKDGILFMGDVCDQEKKQDLFDSLKYFKSTHPNNKTKLDFSNELFLNKQFIRFTLKHHSKFVNANVKFFDKIASLSNELTEYRFDTVIKLCGSTASLPSSMTLTGCFTFKDVINSSCSSLHKFNLDDYKNRTTLKDECYILFTSGTTGQPRGVIITNENLLNYVKWSVQAYRMNEDTICPLFSKLTFDFTLTTLICPLLAGGKIVVFDRFECAYAHIANNCRLNLVKLSPLQLDIIIKYCFESETSLVINTFIIGGEALKVSTLNSLKALQKDRPFFLYNEYGPTEATVGCIVSCFSSETLPLKENSIIEIGRPIDNTSVFIVDANTKIILPRGARGKLVIYGSGICKSFTNSLTTNLRHMTTFKKSFETDDIASIQIENSSLAYHGRESSLNVKMNGMRIDLKEISNEIEKLPFVIQAWCLVVQVDQKNILSAYVQINKASGPINDIEIRNMLENVLAKQFIPTLYYISSNTAPINSNGKVDYNVMRTLLSESFYKASLNKSFENGCKELESEAENDELVFTLKQIFAQVLNLKQLPHIKADFFSLGGDSIQAIYITRKMNLANIRFQLQMIYQHPTIEQLAKYIKLNNLAETNLKVNNVLIN